MNAPATFMQTMNNLFSDMLDSGIAVFPDDILVYSPMVKEQFMLLEKALVYLHQYNFYRKLKKFSFLHNSITFLDLNLNPKRMHIRLKGTKFE